MGIRTSWILVLNTTSLSGIVITQTYLSHDRMSISILSAYQPHLSLLLLSSFLSIENMITDVS